MMGGEEPMADGDRASDSKRFRQLGIGQEMQEVRVTDGWPSSTKNVCITLPQSGYNKKADLLGLV